MKLTAKINMIHQHTVLPKSSCQFHGVLNSVPRYLGVHVIYKQGMFVKHWRIYEVIVNNLCEFACIFYNYRCLAEFVISDQVTIY